MFLLASIGLFWDTMDKEISVTQAIEIVYDIVRKVIKATRHKVFFFSVLAVSRSCSDNS